MSRMMTITFDPAPISVESMVQAIELVTGRKAARVEEHDETRSDDAVPLRCVSCRRPVELDLTHALEWAQPGDDRCSAVHAGSGNNRCERRAGHEDDGTAWSHLHAYRYGPADAYRVFRWVSSNSDLVESRLSRMASEILMTPCRNGQR